MAGISWTEWSVQRTTLRRQNAVAEAALPIASNLALENIRFRYRISGDNPPWKPVRAFDDDHKVYIEFPRRIDKGEAPPLFVVGTDGGSELVRSEEHTSELQPLMRSSYAVVCLKKNKYQIS